MNKEVGHFRDTITKIKQDVKDNYKRKRKNKAAVNEEAILTEWAEMEKKLKEVDEMTGEAIAEMKNQFIAEV